MTVPLPRHSPRVGNSARSRKQAPRSRLCSPLQAAALSPKTPRERESLTLLGNICQASLPSASLICIALPTCTMQQRG